MFKLYDRGRLKFKRIKNIYIIQILLFLKKKARVATLIPDKVGFRTKKIIRDKKGNYVMRRINLPGRHNNLKCTCIKPRSLKIYEAKTDRVYRRNRQTHS